MAQTNMETDSKHELGHDETKVVPHLDDAALDDKHLDDSAAALRGQDLAFTAEEARAVRWKGALLAFSCACSPSGPLSS
jgi:hypothetical protein